MTQPNRHCIQRQVVELSLAGGVAGPAVQESFARTFHEDIVPEIESVFDRAASAQQLLRIDRLEIDLGTIAASDWQPELRRRLSNELAQRLARYTPESRIPDPRVPLDANSNEPLRQFLFYLAHGRIPWWGERPAAGWSAAMPAAALDSPALRATLRAEPNARLRFIDSFDDAVLELAVTRWCGVPHAVRVLEWMARQGAALRTRVQWRRTFWSRLLDAALEPDVLTVQGPVLLRELLDQWLVARAETTTAAEVTRTSAEPDAGQTPSPRLEELPSPWREWLASAQSLTPRAPGSPEAPAGETDATGRVTSLAAARARAHEKRSQARMDEDSIYLPGAGVVLLHPFLEPLFRDRGLLESRDFRDAGVRERAVHLVGLLTFGCRDVAEYDLVAAKLLCGHPLDQPIAPVELDDADAAACDELLAAVLRHWTALRSSSTEWLRGRFFLRDGKIERVDEGFRLTVERHAQDVLLARLPWGFGVIGFPWMNEKVFVRWLD